jgi:hypothetical protein
MNKYYNEVCGEFNKYDEVIIEGTLLYLNEETEKVLVSDLEFSRDNLLLIEHTIWQNGRNSRFVLKEAEKETENAFSETMNNNLQEKLQDPSKMMYL